jgi:hypothetical protein
MARCELKLMKVRPQTTDIDTRMNIYTANNNSVRLLKKLQEFGSFNLLRILPEFFQENFFSEFFQEFSGIFSGKDPARIHTTNML